MWPRALLLALLLAATQASVFTDGGELSADNAYPDDVNEEAYIARLQKLYENSENEYRNQENEFRNLEYRTPEDEGQDFRLERETEEEPVLNQILEQLAAQQPIYDTPEENVEISMVPQENEQRESEKIVARETSQKEESPDTQSVVEQKPLVAQKKGQSEFVSFVEPVESKQTKSIQSVDKRKLQAGGPERKAYTHQYGNSLLIIAVGTVCVVGTIGAVAGGVYVKRRSDTPDDSEYAPYAGTGPALKKGKKGDKGDEALAYKAQLHHYQQAKQKIICGEDVPGVMDSEGEDDGVDDENNFSVYECPGLAPTGDIEVVNPNFAANP